MVSRTQNGRARWGRYNWVVPLVKHRELLWQFTMRTLDSRHKGSHLGLAWSLLNPLLMLGLYVFVFGYVFGGKNQGQAPLDYALGIFVGLSLFHFVAETFGIAPTVIVGNPSFVKKVVFPLEILPAATVGAAFVHLLISLGLVLIGTVFTSGGLGWSVLWLPVILAPLLLLVLGLAWAIAAVCVFFRDLTQFTSFMSMALMFASAVFYPAQSIPAQSPFAWAILRFNPLIHAIELARDAMLRNLPMDYGSLGYLYGAALVVVTGGYWLFHKLRPAFADVI